MNRVDPCEPFQLLISAALDGELDEREQVDLDHHLSSCEACQQWQSAITRQEELLVSLAAAQAQDEYTDGTTGKSDLPSRAAEQPIPKPLSSASQRRGSSWRVIGFSSLAAAVLLGVGLVVATLVRQQRTGTTIDVEPLAAMHAINVQSEEDQQAILRTVELDLRAMRLELQRIQLDDASRKQLGTQIDSLLAKTRQLQPSTPVSYQGGRR